MCGHKGVDAGQWPDLIWYVVSVFVRVYNCVGIPLNYSIQNEHLGVEFMLV